MREAQAKQKGSVDPATIMPPNGSDLPHALHPHSLSRADLDEAPLPFWRKPLSALTVAEWESLCDGCGRCCLIKLEDEDTQAIYFTDVVCTLFDRGTCRCSDYGQRQSRVPDCIKLTPDIVDALTWLPPTCAYRLVDEGRDLMWWHPLVSGRAETVHEAGISVRGRSVALEDDVPVEQLPDHIVSWPKRWPKKGRGRLPR